MHPLFNLLLTYYRYRNPDDPVGGFLILGGSDPAYYEGEMHYVDLSATTYWQVSMKGYEFSINDDMEQLSRKYKNQNVELT